MNILSNPTENELSQVIQELNNGGLIVYPTDTIYGLGASINNEKAIKKVYEIKHRSLKRPISVCLHDYKQLEQVAQVNKPVNRIIKTLLPGSYTLLLKKQDYVSNLLTSGTNTIGIRIPNNTITHALTKDFPITSTSANISDLLTPNNINDIKKQLGDNISTYIDVGVMINNQPSTIIDLTGKKPVILRKGQYDKKLLQDILKINLY